jgi:hypothetical protein
MRDDRRWYENAATAEQRRRFARFHSIASGVDRKYWTALSLYGVLAVLAWFTVGEGTVVVFGKPVELRLIPVLILATFALRTVLVRQADKIRHGGE